MNELATVVFWGGSVVVMGFFVVLALLRWAVRKDTKQKLRGIQNGNGIER
jgi:hypothetical protein